MDEEFPLESELEGIIDESEVLAAPAASDADRPSERAPPATTASSSSDAMVRAPGRRVAASGTALGRFLDRDDVFWCEGGNLMHYASNGDFVAYCDNPDHDRCVLTRTSFPSKRSGRVGQGRPLGRLCAWLMCNDQATRAEHLQHVPSLEDRRRCRQLYRSSAAFRQLEALERPRADGEASEPETVP